MTDALPEGRNGWRTMESAPKDGSAILLYSPDCETGPFIASWRDYGGDDEGAWWECEESSFPVDADPTHWMPLPEPPLALERGE